MVCADGHLTKLGIERNQHTDGDPYTHPLERLLRYCARPPFAMDRLRKEGAALVYRCAKQHLAPQAAPDFEGDQRINW